MPLYYFLNTKLGRLNTPKLCCDRHHLQNKPAACGPDRVLFLLHRLHRQQGALALFGEQKVIFESHVTFEDNIMEVSSRRYTAVEPFA